jgi:hypothetical protein
MYDLLAKSEAFDDSPSCVLYSRRKGGTAVGTCLAVERQVSSPETGEKIKKWKEKKEISFSVG